MTYEPVHPPHQLIQKWWNEWTDSYPTDSSVDYIAHRAAQWAADEAIQACCKFIDERGYSRLCSELEESSQPKPPSLKQQAIKQLDRLTADLEFHNENYDDSTIRRALEALPDD
jgi:hypothetical protein